MVKQTKDVMSNATEFAILQRSTKINKLARQSIVHKSIYAQKMRLNNENYPSVNFHIKLEKCEQIKQKYYMRALRTIFSAQEERNAYQQRCLEHFQFMRKCFSVIKKLPPTCATQVVTSQSTSSKKLLVLDLDETLIHTFERDAPNDCVRVCAKIYDTHDRIISFKVRPHCAEFLREMSTRFDLCVFTAGHASYANPILDYLDPTHTLFKHRLFSDSCTRLAKYTLKDLTIFKRDLKDIILVDNTPLCFGLQKENGVPVLCYTGQADDAELPALGKFLAHLAGCGDVRGEIAQHFKWELLERMYADTDALRQYYF